MEQQPMIHAPTLPGAVSAYAAATLPGMRTPPELFRAAARSDPGRPFVTFYDDATGERVELSFSTTDNWVAKTATLLIEDLGAEPGERVALFLPTHWQSVVFYLACWTAGVVAAPTADPARCAHAVADPTHVAELAACPGGRLLVPLRPMGGRALDLPAGVLDYAAEVPAQPDRFLAAPPPTPDDPALDRDGILLSAGEVVDLARRTAAELGLHAGSRLLVDADLGTAKGLTRVLLAPLAVGASVVLCRNLDPAAVARRVATERITDRLS
jgi:uncharacterized protein (TIGR03089 family)